MANYKDDDSLNVARDNVPGAVGSSHQNFREHTEQYTRNAVCTAFRMKAMLRWCIVFLIIQEEDLQEMLRASKELEDNYGKFFDLTVVNKDTEEAYNNIIEAIEGLEREEQWVPRDWVQ